MTFVSFKGGSDLSLDFHIWKSIHGLSDTLEFFGQKKANIMDVFFFFLRLQSCWLNRLQSK